MSPMPRQQKCNLKLDAGGDTHSRAHVANVLSVIVYLCVVVSAMCLYELLLVSCCGILCVAVQLCSL